MKEEAKEAAKAAKVDIVGGMELIKKVDAIQLLHNIAHTDRSSIAKFGLIFACVLTNSTQKYSHYIKS